MPTVRRARWPSDPLPDLAELPGSLEVDVRPTSAVCEVTDGQLERHGRPDVVATVVEEAVVVLVVEGSMPAVSDSPRSPVVEPLLEVPQAARPVAAIPAARTPSMRRRVSVVPRSNARPWSVMSSVGRGSGRRSWCVSWRASSGVVTLPYGKDRS